MLKPEIQRQRDVKLYFQQVEMISRVKRDATDLSFSDCCKYYLSKKNIKWLFVYLKSSKVYYSTWSL